MKKRTVLRQARDERFWVLAVALLAASCAQGPRYDGPNLRPIAQPGEVVAAELGFARAAQEKGQWTAFADYATDDAVMFVPQAVNAQAWLKGRANPANAVKWQPHQVWSSCDGSLAVTKGPWQRPNGTVGYFTTVWERQKDGEYKWVLDMGDALSAPLPEVDMVQAKVADCNSGQAIASVNANYLDGNPATGSASSRDGTLAYDWEVARDGALTFELNLIEGEKMVQVLVNSVAAPAE